MKPTKLLHKTTEQLASDADVRLPVTLATMGLVLVLSMGVRLWVHLGPAATDSDRAVCALFIALSVLQACVILGCAQGAFAAAQELAKRHDPEYEAYRLRALKREAGPGQTGATPALTDKPTTACD